MVFANSSVIATDSAPIQLRFAKRLKYLRDAKGLSVADLAHASGLDDGVVLASENEHSETTLEVLAALSDGLKLPISSVLEGV